MKISDFLPENPHLNFTDLDHSMFGKVQQNSLENLNRVCHYLGAKEISDRGLIPKIHKCIKENYTQNARIAPNGIVS